MTKATLPGTIWKNKTRYWWKVRLPGTKKRKAYPLVPPGEKYALHESRGRDLAESIAWRLYEDASSSAIQNAEPDGLTLDQVCAKFVAWAKTYYRHADGTPTGEHYNCELALRELRSRYRHKPINEITYHNIISTRDAMVRGGLTRGVVNQRVGVWKRMFAWALENRLCSAQTKSEVWAITALKRHRSSAREGAGQTPIAHRHVKAVLPHLPPLIRVMVQVHELCGARPTEMCLMRPCDIDRRRKVWVYEPARHKTEHTGRHRIICLGPKAQALLAPLLRNTPGDQYIFRPVGVREWRIRQGQKVTRKPTSNAPKEYYTKDSYALAVKSGIAKARKAGQPVPSWTPNQLRHACATRVRRRYGREAARLVLGHASSGGGVTDIYTADAIKKEELRALTPVMLRLG